MLNTVIGKDYRPICFTENGLLVYKKEKFYIVNPIDDTASFLCNIKIEDRRRPMCITRLGERLSHLSAYCGIEVDKGAIVAYNKGIYFINTSSGDYVKEFDFKIKGMRRPLNFYKIEGVKGFDEMVLCPDYCFNKDRESVDIYYRTEDCKWERIYTFKEGLIRHIHSIINDPYRDRVLILTGDFGDECAIWEVKNNFKHVRKIIGSQQNYRACCAKAYEEGVVIVTDSPFDQNYIYLLKEDDGNVKVDVISKTNGPAVFFTYYNDYLVFDTDVEYDEELTQGFIKYFTYKRGRGVLDWYSHMYIGSLNKGFEEIKKFKKDILPMVSFGFGTVIFPNGFYKGKLYYYPMAVKKYDRKLCYINMEKYDESC